MLIFKSDHKADTQSSDFKKSNANGFSGRDEKEYSMQHDQDKRDHRIPVPHLDQPDPIFDVDVLIMINT